MNLTNGTPLNTSSHQLHKESTDRTPLLFFGHGSPLNALADNEYTKSWAKMSEGLNPKVIVVISAHWETSGSFIYSGPNNKMIYDFYGFPKELFQVQYPAPSSPSLASEISLNYPKIDLHEDWGLDHGAWSVLVKSFPRAEIPVIQLSLNQNLTLKEHWDLAKELQYLRRLGVLVVGSGNIVHNLRKMSRNTDVPNWSREFQNKVIEIIKSKEYHKLTELDQDPNFKIAHPTIEHFIPLVYIFAMAEMDEEVQVFTPKIELGSISMTSFKVE